MNWVRIAWSATLPIALAAPFVALLWHKRQFMLGAVVGAGILLASAVTYGGLEFVDGLRYRFECQATETPCPPSNPSDFVKMTPYGIVAFVQVAALFTLCEWAERKLREEEYSPRWRR